MITLRLNEEQRNVLIKASNNYSDDLSKKVGQIVTDLLTEMDIVNGKYQRVITVEERKMIMRICRQSGSIQAQDILDELEEKLAA